LDLDGKAVIYAPVYGRSRAQWVQSQLYGASQESLHNLGIDRIEPLGDSCSGYMLSECALPQYRKLQNDLAESISKGNNIFTLYGQGNYPDQKLILKTLAQEFDQLNSAVCDISRLGAQMRRRKSQDELEIIAQAIERTMAAQDMVAHVLEPHKYEYQVQAAAEFMFTETGAQPAFPSIVAGGANGTILHYNSNKDVLQQGDLVLIDIGAEYNYYCGDLSRTYPIGGMFSNKQRQLYSVVLETQRYLEELVRPGIWLRNNQQPQKSLHHLAVEFLQKRGYSDYFVHGIGHYLGLDVHDVGDYSTPLQEGDVITLEPGIYMHKERIGIRIEDNYVLISGGALCLSEQLPKDPEAIEELMASSLEDYEENEYQRE